MDTSRTASRTDRAIDAALWTAGLLFAGLTLVYSLVVTPPQDRALAIGDTWLHTASYFATGLCLLLAALRRPGRGDALFPTWGLRRAVALVAAGALIEVGQAAFTSRQAERADSLADLIGLAQRCSCTGCSGGRLANELSGEGQATPQTA